MFGASNSQHHFQRQSKNARHEFFFGTTSCDHQYTHRASCPQSIAQLTQACTMLRSQMSWQAYCASHIQSSLVRDDPSQPLFKNGNIPRARMDPDHACHNALPMLPRGDHTSRGSLMSGIELGLWSFRHVRMHQGAVALPHTLNL